MYSGVERTTCDSSEVAAHQRKQDQREDAARDQRDLGEHQRVDQPRQRLIAQDRPQPSHQRAPCGEVRKVCPAQGTRYDVVAEESGQVLPQAVAVQRLGEPHERENTAGNEERQRGRPHPQPSRADQQEEYRNECGGFRIEALAEIAF